MTDQVPSGASAAQAADNSAPATSAPTASAHPAADTTQPFGTFGTTRGSGLARGKKRPLPAETSAATAAPGGYQPTALEVIVPQREYKNPFEDTAATAAASSTEAPGAKADSAPAAVQPAPAPVQPAPRAEPVRTPAREPRPYVAPVAHVPAPVPSSRSEIPAAVPPSSGDLFPLEGTPQSDSAGRPAEASPRAEPVVRAPLPPKSELKILPPAETRRAPLSWEKAPQAQKGPAPAYPPRPGRDDRREERRDDRPTFRTDAQRSRDLQQAPASPGASQSGGFLAWLKGLFGGKKTETAAAPARSPEGEFDRGGQTGGQHDGQRRRRHRGGRGRNRGEGGGPAQSHGSEGGQPHSQGGEYRGEPRGEFRGGQPGSPSGGQHDGQRRRRHRGGRGRNRGEGGGPRSEGQQGGGFI